MKKNKDKQLLIEQLKKIPIIQIGCEKINVGRTTFYRWLKEDPKFSKAVDEAIKESTELINDLSQSQLITLIREKKMPAIALWLKVHHPLYSDKIEVKIKNSDDSLTPEQAEAIKAALRLTSSSADNPSTENNKND